MRRPALGGGGLSILACDAIAGTLAREARQRQCTVRWERARVSDEEAETPAEPSPKPVHAGAGHRARLRQRLLEGGAEALADYEVLEYLLFTANPRGDTKPLAKELLARFGSLSSVLDAEPGALRQVKGISDAGVGALKIAALAARRMARSEVRQQPVLGSWQALLDYLAIDMAHLTVERVRVLYLDSRNRLVSDHLASEGTIDEAAIHPREVTRRGPDLGATALILLQT